MNSLFSLIKANRKRDLRRNVTPLSHVKFKLFWFLFVNIVVVFLLLILDRYR